MSYRVQCSACGKVMTLEDDAAGETLVCIACGTRLEAPPPPIVQAFEAQAEGDNADTTDVPASTGARRVRSSVRKSGPRVNRVSTPVLVALLVAIPVIALLSWAIARRGAPAPRHNAMAENVRNNADLLTLKSEAESLAIQGQLAEAHEKYRRLQQLAVGRDIKDPLFWDIMERAKFDQDKIYTMLLNQMAPAVPDPRPGLVDRDGYPVQQPARFDEAEDTSAKGEAATEESPADATTPPLQTAPSTQSVATAPVATRPAPASTQPEVQVSYSVTDDQVGEALKRGVDYLLPQFENGQLEGQGGMSPIRHAGLNALCVYALLTTGQAMKDPRLDVRGEFMKKLVETMKAHDLRPREGDPQQPVTYARSLRAAALAVCNRPEDAKALKDDVNWLVAAAMSGAYTYDDRFTRAPGPQAGAFTPSPLVGEGRGEGDAAGVEVRNFATLLPMFTPHPSPLPQGEGESGAAVIPIHGYHDPRTGRELGTPPPPWGPGFGRDSRTPIPNPYPRRTPQPRIFVPNTTMPPGGYGPGWVGAPQPQALPERSGTQPTVRFPWDNSNSQYGLLGVWSGAEVGVEVPVRYWRDVEKHWTSSQLRTGEWGYRETDAAGMLAMTCGGLASLFVTHDWLAAPMVKGSTGRDPLTRNLAAGLAWLERDNHCLDTPNAKTHYVGYDLYGLERVGLASGYKYFAGHDWYRELATKMVASQWPNGAWGRGQDGPDTVIDTAYTLLFLSRGRHPILMNKLRFDRSDVTRVDGKPAPGYWANRPRDVANLTRFASRQLERGLNWQVVSLDVDWGDWMDAPVLYVASHQQPALTDEQYEKLRGFVEGGGLIFTHADAGAGAFNRWVPKLVAKVCPGYTLQDLPDDHLLYSAHYKIKSPRPKLQAVSNGARLLLVHSPADLATVWQQRGEKVYPDTFRLGVNLFLYAGGKTELRNRLDTPYVPEPTAEPEGRFQVARLKYPGNWDPEPGAWARFRREFEWATRTAVEHPPVDLRDLKYGVPTNESAPDASGTIAHLTGNAAYTFSDADVAAVKSFVESGGLLLIDACGGSRAFHESARDTLLDKAFPGVKPESIPADHPLLRPVGATEPLVLKPRPYVAEALPDGAASVQLIKAGKGCVVVSQLDLTSGLLGTHTWGVVGYEPEACSQFLHNALLYSMNMASP